MTAAPAAREPLSIHAARLRDDGVVFLPQALDAATLALAERAFDWSLAHPSPSAHQFYQHEEGRFYHDLCHPDAASAYRELLTASAIPDLVAALWKHPDVWFLYEQIFLKEGPSARRTPWHQDSPYLALDGERIAVMWIAFEPLKEASSLEFVRGSHRETMYDGSAFDAHDDTRPIYGKDLPRLPDIEADRAAWDIVSWAVAPGDVVVFHPNLLHGGAPTRDGVRRRTLSLRFFGDDAVYAARPTPAFAPRVTDLHERLQPGDPFRHPAFPKLRPRPEGFAPTGDKGTARGPRAYPGQRHARR